MKKFIFLIKFIHIFEENNKWVIGDWGLGIGDWGLGPIPNPQSPIPNPHIKASHLIYIIMSKNIIYKFKYLKILY